MIKIKGTTKLARNFLGLSEGPLSLTCVCCTLAGEPPHYKDTSGPVGHVALKFEHSIYLLFQTRSDIFRPHGHIKKITTTSAY